VPHQQHQDDASSLATASHNASVSDSELLILKAMGTNHDGLPSLAIQTHKLLPLNYALEKYLKLQDESNAGNLEQKSHM